MLQYYMAYRPTTARRLALATLLLGVVAATPIGAQEEAASALAARIQQKYDTVRDFSADFVQTYEGGVLRRTTSERGTVVVKKPGRMRWTYTAPERKEFVADGRKLYSYVPADRQVIVSEMPTGDEASTPVLFLVGKGRLTRDFYVTYTTIADAPAGTVALRLTPRHEAREYEWLTLVVDRETLGLRMLIAGDAQGGTSTFAFTNLKENVGVSDTSFRFSIPRGADVITQG